MKVTIERVFCRYSDRSNWYLFPCHQHDSFFIEEAESRASMERQKVKNRLDDYLVFGHGAYHPGVFQRCPVARLKFSRTG